MKNAILSMRHRTGQMPSETCKNTDAKMVITDLWMQHYFGPHNEVKLASAFNKWQITNKNNEFNVSKYLLYTLQYIDLRSICDKLINLNTKLAKVQQTWTWIESITLHSICTERQKSACIWHSFDCNPIIILWCIAIY